MSDMRIRTRVDSQLLLREMGPDGGGESPAVAFHSLPETSRLVVMVAEVSGTDPTLELTLQGLREGGDWTDLSRLLVIDAPGIYSEAIGPQGYTYYRVASSVGGTDNPSFTHLVALTC